MGWLDFIHRLKIYKYAYEKKICNICNQVCYNKMDLDIHKQREHILREKEKVEKESSIEIDKGEKFRV